MRREGRTPLLKQSHKLLRGLGNVEGALDDLLSDEVLVKRLPLTPDYQHPTLGLKMICRRRQRRQVCRDSGVARFLKSIKYKFDTCFEEESYHYLWKE